MATKTVEIANIGKVNLRKHSTAKSIRISLAPNGDVNVTLPRWVPYNMAIKFVTNKQQWIADNKVQQNIFTDGQVIGKSNVLKFEPDITAKITARTRGSMLIVKYPDSLSSTATVVQTKAMDISVKALRVQAEDILPDRLRDLASQHNFEVKSIAIRNLKARWGSCSSKKEITLNLYLMLLPWELIDYVILHELSHTKAMHHGADFWRVFEAVLPDAKQRRKQMKQYKPAF